MRVLDLAQKLDDVFGYVNESRVKGYIEELRRMLGKYEGEPLAHAYELVTASWRERFRPLPAEFANVCRAYEAANDTKYDRISEELKRAERFRNNEFRTFIDRTIERHSAEIEAKAKYWADIPDSKDDHLINPFRASVVAYIETQARMSHWYCRLTAAPYAMDFKENDWNRIQSICEVSEPMMRANNTKKLAKYVHENMLDGYQAQ